MFTSKTGAAVIQCPDLSSVQIGPDHADVGGSVALTVADLADVDAGATVYSWAAPSGQFSAPSSPITSFMCTQAGTVVVTVTARREGCTETMTASIRCDARTDGG